MRCLKSLVSSLVLGVLGVQGLAAWTEQDYAKETPKSFFLRPDVQARIDFSRPDLALLNATVFYETNLRRTEQGLPPLIHLSALDQAAYGHAQDMVSYNYFSHSSPLAGLRNVQERLAAVGIRGGVQGENIARGFGLEYDSGRPVYPPSETGAGFRYTLNGPDLLPRTYAGLARALLDQLMSSPDHRAIVLSPDFRFLGDSIVPYKAVNFYNMEYFMAVQDYSSVRPDS
jgi:uncharacterized protein YkwD